jgi:hypothetical protein
MSYPIMKKLVPAVKTLRTFLDIKKQLELMGPNASEMKQRVMAREVVKSMEDWHGQMSRDNLVINHAFWNRSLADALGVAFKFVEFSFGTLRGMFGADADVAKLTKRWELTPRLAKAIAFPFALAMMGSLVQKLMTGQNPDSIQDLFEPRTGRKNPDGTDERLNLPTYWRTAVQWSAPVRDFSRGDIEQATTDLKLATRGRLSGGVDTLIMWLTNKDFYGREIRKSHVESDPHWRTILKLGDFMKAVAREMTPIGPKNAFDAWERDESAGQIAGRLAGLSPVNAAQSRTAAENKIAGFLSEGMGDKPMTDSEYNARELKGRLKSQIRSGDPSGIGPAMASHEITPKAGMRLMSEARKSLYDRANLLNPDEFLQVWEVAKPDERAKLRMALIKERQKVLVGPVSERARLLPLYNQAWLEVR